MNTKSWGPYTWVSEHAITFSYPKNPTLKDIENYKKHFINLANLLPCELCRVSYKQFISEGKYKITDEIFKSRDNLTYWFYNIHELVNQKLDVKYYVTYEELKNKYNSDNPTYDFNFRDCPIINSEIINKFLKYIEIRLSENYDKEKINNYMNILNHVKENINYYIKNKNKKIWKKRNAICRKYLKKNNNGIEKSGKYKDLPTIDEIKLMIYCCSTLGEKKLLNIVSNNINNMIN